jgi:hypothetical protein
MFEPGAYYVGDPIVVLQADDLRQILFESGGPSGVVSGQRDLLASAKFIQRILMFVTCHTFWQNYEALPVLCMTHKTTVGALTLAYLVASRGSGLAKFASRIKLYLLKVLSVSAQMTALQLDTFTSL